MARIKGKVGYGMINHRSGSSNGFATASNPGRFARWNKNLIVEELKKLHRQGKHIWSRQLRQSHPSLHAAAIHWFGSFRNAVEAARIDYSKVMRMIPGRWNTGSVRKELRRLHKEKVAMHHASLQREHPDLMLAAYRYFGSYGKAVEAAGLNYSRIRIRPMPSWDKKRIAQRLKELAKEDTGLWKRAVRRTDPYLERAAKRCFGSYERAARAVGITAKQLEPPSYRKWSPKRITEELSALYRRSPRLLKPSTLAEKDRRLLQACRRQFGTYKKALEAAGIEYAEVARTTAPALSAEQITTWLKDLFERGRDLRYSHLGRQNPRLLEAARRRFGSYQAAINAAGLDYPPAPPMSHWTASLVLKTLKDLHRRKADLRFRQLRKARLPLFEAARHYFGTYLGAIKAAKIDYDQVVKEQLGRQLPRRALAKA